jgi:hypothetical protein
MDIDLLRLGETLQSFIEFVQCLDPESLKPARTKKWGPREVLTHLVFWHECYSRLAAAAAGGKESKPLKGTLKAINAQAVALNKDVPVHELIARWVKAQKGLARTAQKPKAGQIKVALTETSKEWKLPELIRMAANHIAKHETGLREELKMSRRAIRSAASL